MFLFDFNLIMLGLCAKESNVLPSDTGFRARINYNSRKYKYLMREEIINISCTKISFRAFTKLFKKIALKLNFEENITFLV